MNTVSATTTGLELWLDPLLEDLPGLSIIDAHTHVGTDCDGTACEPADLILALDSLGARAVTFPLHVEGGYTRANDAVMAAAAASSQNPPARSR